MRRVTEYEKIRGLIEPSKGKISNCYWMPGDYFEAIQSKHLYEADAVGGYAWIYRTEGRNQFFYQTNRDNADKYACQLPEDYDYVAEILHRGLPSEHLETEKRILSRCGFQFHDLARMMTCKPPFGPFVQAQDHRIRQASNEDCQTIASLLEASFDSLTDAIPTEGALLNCINSGAIWVIEDLSNGGILGCTLFESAGKRTWIRHVTVKKEMRGKGIASELIQTFIAQEKPDNEYLLWVKDENKAAVSLYSKLGFVAANRQMDIWTKMHK